MKKKLAMLGCAGLMTVATIGGAYALYSGTAKTVENKFNIVAGADHGTEGFDPSNPDGPTDGTDGTVEEGNWGTVDEDSDGQPDDINGDGMIDENDKPDTDGDGIYDSADDLEPGQKVLKNPSITSNVNYESWVVMRVNIPTVSGRLSDEASVTRHDAVILAKNGFEEVAEPAVGHKLGEDAVLLSKYEQDGQTVYYYGFLEPLQSKEKDPHETPALFDYFRVQDFAEIDVNNSDGRSSTEDNVGVDVSAAMIQTTNVKDIYAAGAELGICEATSTSDTTNTTDSSSTQTGNEG